MYYLLKYKNFLHKIRNQPRFFSMALVCILRTVFEQLVNSRAVTNFNLFYDVISILVLAILLFFVSTLCYEPRINFSWPTLY
jgi:magnesium-transporting ATPase (P-type)